MSEDEPLIDRSVHEAGNVTESSSGDTGNEETALSFKSSTLPIDVDGTSQTVYESLDYDPMENFIYMGALRAKTMRAFRREAVIRWVIVLSIGVVTALVAFFIDEGTELISDFKFSITTKLIAECHNCFFLPYLTYLFSNVLLVSIAAYLVAFVEPVAMGSGIPEIKCYLNGVKVPRVVRAKTLVSKALGVLFSVAGGLACGKEGPMIHSGAIVAAGLSQLKSSHVRGLRQGVWNGVMEPYRNDNEKRDFVSGGAAAGVAAAFGAPVGGVLFSLEEGSSFWNQSLTWRTFACSMVCSFILNVMLSGTVVGGTWGNLTQPGLAVFGSFTAQGNPGFSVFQIPFFLVLGMVGGLFGAAFNAANLKLTIWRRKRIITPWRRMLEALLIAALTSTASFAVSYWARDCRPLSAVEMTTSNGTTPMPTMAPDMGATAQFMPPSTRKSSSLFGGPRGSMNVDPVFTTPEAEDALGSSGESRKRGSHTRREKASLDLERPEQFTYFCARNEYNAMASIFFTTQERAIRRLFHSQQNFGLQTLGIFFSVFLVLSCITYGVAVPSGLFVPSILCGCALGRLCGEALASLFGPGYGFDPGVFALVGGAAVLGGIVRMTISLTVIIVESTNDVTYGLPVMMTLMVAKWVGDYFGHGIYDMHIELAKVPFLDWEPPMVMRKFRASNVMSKPVVTFFQLEKVSRILEVLSETRHNGFPVLDMITDRCQTACLTCLLCVFYPAHQSLLALSIALDFASHYVHMYSSLLRGANSHKDVAAHQPWLLRVYYTNRIWMGFLVAANEGFFLTLYTLHFTQGPLLNFPTPIGAFRFFLYLTTPFMATKQLMNVIQMAVAFRDIARDGAREGRREIAGELVRASARVVAARSRSKSPARRKGKKNV